MKHEEIIAKVHEALEEKSLNFTAKMAESYAFVDGVYVPTGRYTPIRTDKTGKDAIIGGGNFSKNFTPIQNEDAFAMLGEMADVADIDFVYMGSWGNGAGVYAQISLGEIDGIGATGDKVGKYISVVNAHDGSRSLQLLITPYRFFCKNQIAKAISEAQRGNRLVSICHTTHGVDRLRELALAMEAANNAFNASGDEYKRLADRRVTMEEVREAMFRCLPIPYDPRIGITPRVRKNWEEKVGRLVARFNNADDGKLEALTGWNLYNAIQGTIQHDTKKSKMYEKSLILGDIATKSATSLQVVSDILFNGGYTKTSTAEFDELFARVA